jgi:hypothetical protein
MGSPTIFSGRYTKLLTQKGLLQQGGAVNQYDGLRNYIKNSSFESNTDEGWNRVKTTITGNLPTGTPTIGKSIAVAPSISSFGPFSGSAPFDRFALRFGNIISTVVAGEGVISDAFTVDPGDRGKVLTFKLYYQSDAGASTDNWSGVLGSQTWAVYIYDQTAGAWLQPTGFLGMNQNSGVGVVSGTFQSSVVAGQQYRIAVIALRNTTSTSALQIDDVYVGPQTAPIGPVVTDWVSYTPTGSWANTTYAGIWRRVGDTMQGRVRLACTGVPTNATLTVSLPSGYSIDLAKYPSSQPATVGNAYVEDAAITGFDGFTYVFNSTSIAIKVLDVNASYARGATITGNTIPFAWNNQDYIVLDFSVIISGWSSSVQMSNDTDTRVVAFFKNNVNPATTYPLGVTDITWLNASAVQSDTHGAWNGTLYTIPVSGYYQLTTQFILNNLIYTAGAQYDLFWADSANNTIYDKAQFTMGAGTGRISGGVVSPPIYFNAGQTLKPRYFNGVIANTSFQGIYIGIQRLSGPSVVAASETVAAKYYLAGAVSTSTTQPINFATKSYDTHNAVTTGASWRFTTPVSGLYRISNVFVNGSAPTVDVALYVNGISSDIMESGDNSRYWNGTTSIRLNAGDYIDLRATSATTTAAVSQRITIERVGN